jgi:hypothetical protein
MIRKIGLANQTKPLVSPNTVLGLLSMVLFPVSVWIMLEIASSAACVCSIRSIFSEGREREKVGCWIHEESI